LPGLWIHTSLKLIILCGPYSQPLQLNPAAAMVIPRAKRNFMVIFEEGNV